MNINDKIRFIAKQKENQRQAFVCKGKGAEARPSLPYAKYPKLVGPGGGDSSYNTTYTLDENGRVSSITYRFPDEVASIPILENLGTDININFDNFNPPGPYPSSGYAYNYLNSNNIKKIWLGNEVLAESLYFPSLFKYAYVIAPNLKKIGKMAGDFCNSAAVGEFPELEEFSGGYFYTKTITEVVSSERFPKLKKLGINGYNVFGTCKEIYLTNVNTITDDIGGNNLKILNVENLENIPNGFAKKAKYLEQLYLGQVQNNYNILNNHTNPSSCTIYLKSGSNSDFITRMTTRGFNVVEV